MMLIDRARTRYKSLPAPLRRAVGRAAGILPQRVRFGRTFARTADEIARSRSAPGFVLQRQADLLTAQLVQAYRHSRFWRETFYTAGLDEAALCADPRGALGRLPILTKERLRDCTEDLLTRAPADLDLVTTSGSSGRPLRFYLDRDRSVTEFAFLLDAWAQVGFTAIEKRAALRGFEIPDVDRQPWEYEPGLRELRLSPFHMNDHWLPRLVSEISRRNIRFLHGYPSAIEILGRHVIRAGPAEFGPSIRGIILTSEAFYPHQADVLASAFPNARVLSFYGQSEKALFAISDPADPSLFRFNPLYGIAELIDADGRAITTPGMRGRIIGTGLRFHGMPFLRYDTDDEAELAELPSDNNGFRLAVRNMTSRWGQEFLIGRTGEIISTTALNIHSKAYESMRTFMIEQDRPGRATVKAVLAAGSTPGDAGAFVAEIGRKTGSNMVFDLEIVDDIPAGARGKRNWLRQNLDPAKYRDPN
jgi:phenylacetate-CoA ligase